MDIQVNGVKKVLIGDLDTGKLCLYDDDSVALKINRDSVVIIGDSLSEYVSIHDMEYVIPVKKLTVEI